MANARVYYTNRGCDMMLHALFGNIARMCVEVDGHGKVHYEMTSGDAAGVNGPQRKVLGQCDGSCEREGVQDVDLPEPILNHIKKLLAERQ